MRVGFSAMLVKMKSQLEMFSRALNVINTTNKKKLVRDGVY
jgi:hypothetical protein